MGNTCSGRFARLRKRKRVIPIERIVEEWEQSAVTSHDLLPVEIWDYILSMMNDGKDLLKCREVCHLWKDVADEMLEKPPPWTQVFPYISNVPLIFVGGFGETVVRRIRGTKLNGTRILRQFLRDMRDELENPFPNRTVLLFSNPDLCVPSKGPRHRFYRLMPGLLQNFGMHIWSLEYEIREDTKESVTLLRHFFELTHLKSLTIYARDWNKKRIRKGLLKEQKEIAARQQRGEPFLGELTELKILGCNGIIPLNYIFSSIGHQIKSLYFCFLDDASTITSTGIATILGSDDGFRATEIDQKTELSLNYSLPGMTPNLKNLRVYEVTEEMLGKLFPSTGVRLSSIRHLSVKLQRPFIRPLNRLMQAIDEHCSASLQILHLEISRWHTFDNNDTDETERDQVIAINTDVKLTKLVDFTVAYSLFLHVPDALFRTTEKCPVLKSIDFVSVSIHGGGFPNIESFTSSLWEKLPATLKKIMIRYWTCPPESSSSSTTAAATAAATTTNTTTNILYKKNSKKKAPLLKPISNTQFCSRPNIVIPRRIVE